jgi:NAD(P)-dependent dehydrogenase (short-subunit alcohol dehydrogenase family)
MSPMEPTSISKPRVWFITGTSQGLGRELVAEALMRGDFVVATSRSPETVASIFQAFRDQLLAVSMDLNDSASVAAAVDAVISRFGRIDVLVNNAGYGLLGAVEEANDAEIQKLFETNVFGLLRVTRAVLPHLREQRSGHVVNLSSMSGLTGIAGFGIYCGSKFAVEGISEALAQELAPLGIHLTIVEPGPFRTDFLSGSLGMAAQIIPDYSATAGKARADRDTRNGNQPGDPSRAADAIVQAVTTANPPLHLVLGAWAFERVSQKVEALRKDMEEWRAVSFSTEYETVAK